MKYVVGFCRFWWDFIVGDDWRVAATIVAGIALTAVIADADIAAWWVMPVAVVVALVASLRRATRSA
jgi:hypothetical protein